MEVFVGAFYLIKEERFEMRVNIRCPCFIRLLANEISWEFRTVFLQKVESFLTINTDVVFCYLLHFNVLINRYADG